MDYKNSSYTQEDIEKDLDAVILSLNAQGIEHGDMQDETLRNKYRRDVEKIFAERRMEREEKYFKQIAKFEAMGYTQEEIQLFHDLTYKYAESDFGSKRNLFMFRTQDSKQERTLKLIVGLVFVVFWGVEITTFISDNSPFIKLVKTLIVCSLFGYIWGCILNFVEYDPNEKTYKTCGTCGNAYSGAFCGCFYAIYSNWKK